MRAVRKAGPGRHADPVAVAEAVVFYEDVRIRALKLTAQQDNWLTRMKHEGRPISAHEASTWMADAYAVLEQVARG